MIRSWGIFDKGTGVLRCNYSGPEGTINEQLREGEEAIEGEFDTGLQRIDPNTGSVVEVLPPKPDRNHEWDAALRRWTLTPQAAAALDRKARAKLQIDALEASQARAVREYILGVAGAKDRLTTIDQTIAALRPDLV